MLDGIDVGLADIAGRLQVPDAWRAVSYSSLKPLASWIKDVVIRVEFLRTWLHNGPPPAFPLSNFFFPQVRVVACSDGGVDHSRLLCVYRITSRLGGAVRGRD